MKKDVILQVRIPAELRQKFKEVSAERCQSQSAVIRKMIELYIKGEIKI